MTDVLVAYDATQRAHVAAVTTKLSGSPDSLEAVRAMAGLVSPGNEDDMIKVAAARLMFENNPPHSQLADEQVGAMAGLISAELVRMKHGHAAAATGTGQRGTYPYDEHGRDTRVGGIC